MGIRAKQRVIDTLRAYESLRGVPILTAWHDSEKGYPQITITQISNRAVSHSDNRADFRAPLLQIDIWDRGNPFLVAEKVIAALGETGREPADEREANEKHVNRIILEYRLEE